VRANQCSNPECECSEVTFHLLEAAEDGQSPAKPLALEIRIDPETWQEVQAPERRAPLAECVREFLRDYPPEERLAFQEIGREKQELARRLREYRLDPATMADGRLIAFADIASESGGISSGGRSFTDRFAHEGDEYLVDDLYCTNPGCHCREVHLLFVKYCPALPPDGKVIIDDHFLAKLSLDGGLEIEECFHCTADDARGILSAWRDQCGEAPRVFRWRYQKVKEIARRSLRPADMVQRGNLPPRNPIPASPHPRRNDPCPCGSGKKFKKCCGW